jgi:hypothetical protein
LLKKQELRRSGWKMLPSLQEEHNSSVSSFSGVDMKLAVLKFVAKWRVNLPARLVLKLAEKARA